MTDPEFDATEDKCGEADDGAYTDVSERALAELFAALAGYCEPDGPGWDSSYPNVATDLVPVGATPGVRPKSVRYPTAGTAV
ncbi:hypothetical protein ACFYTS_24735 [Nocardia sp. NPDC004151]|uniref:hypothetical protein n=1 Tax=Nocardia sp. NPDC004151 TaxID=3364304 RepID=UPI0036B4316A